MLIFIPNISYVVDTEIQNQAYSKTKIQSYIRQVPLYTGIKSGYPSLQFFLRTQKIKRIINITIENHAYFFSLKHWYFSYVHVTFFHVRKASENNLFHNMCELYLYIFQKAEESKKTTVQSGQKSPQV